MQRKTRRPCANARSIHSFDEFSLKIFYLNKFVWSGEFHAVFYSFWRHALWSTNASRARLIVFECTVCVSCWLSFVSKAHVLLYFNNKVERNFPLRPELDHSFPRKISLQLIITIYRVNGPCIRPCANGNIYRYPEKRIVRARARGRERNIIIDGKRTNWNNVSFLWKFGIE